MLLNGSPLAGRCSRIVVQAQKGFGPSKRVKPTRKSRPPHDDNGTHQLLGEYSAAKQTAPAPAPAPTPTSRDSASNDVSSATGVVGSRAGRHNAALTEQALTSKQQQQQQQHDKRSASASSTSEQVGNAPAAAQDGQQSSSTDKASISSGSFSTENVESPSSASTRTQPTTVAAAAHSGTIKWDNSTGKDNENIGSDISSRTSNSTVGVNNGQGAVEVTKGNADGGDVATAGSSGTAAAHSSSNSSGRSDARAMDQAHNGASSQDGGASASTSSDPVKQPALPTSFKAAGARHESFESKLTNKRPAVTPPPSPAIGTTPSTSGSSTPIPSSSSSSNNLQVSGQAADSASVAAAAASIARLSVAHDDLAAAEQHVEGLAMLLQEAQATLASLRATPSALSAADAAPVAGITPAPSAAGVPVVDSEAAMAAEAGADRLVGLMSDVLADISVELELVCGQLVAARTDIDDTQQKLQHSFGSGDTAAAIAEPAAPMQSNDTSNSSGGQPGLADSINASTDYSQQQQQEQRQQITEMQTQLQEVQDQLTATQKQNSTLQAQLAVLLPPTPQSSTDGGSVDRPSSSTAGPDTTESTGSSTDDVGGSDSIYGDAFVPQEIFRLRGLLLSQVAANLQVLDQLGVLMQEIVQVTDVPVDRKVKLASAISDCVAAVGSVGANGNSDNGAAAGAAYE